MGSCVRSSRHPCRDGVRHAEQRAADKDNALAAAGFVIRPANTPERQAMLKHLPPKRIVQQAHGDTVSFVYADPLACNCLYIGTQQAYDAYQRYVQQKQLADEQQAAAEMWSDPAWDWGPWGPWPYGP
jgi:hypothetical protein